MRASRGIGRSGRAPPTRETVRAGPSLRASRGPCREVVPESARLRSRGRLSWEASTGLSVGYASFFCAECGSAPSVYRSSGVREGRVRCGPPFDSPSNLTLSLRDVGMRGAAGVFTGARPRPGNWGISMTDGVGILWRPPDPPRASSPMPPMIFLACLTVLIPPTQSSQSSANERDEKLHGEPGF